MYNRGLSSEHTLFVVSGANRKPIYAIPKEFKAGRVTYSFTDPLADQLQDGAKKMTVS